MFKFIPDNVGGLGSKRKLTQRSCDSCKKRHKRCSHAERSSPSQPTGVSPQNGLLDKNPDEAPRVRVLGQNTTSRLPQIGTPEGERQIQQPEISEDAYLRFIGDLSPEASFLSNGGQDDGNKGSRHADVGVWLGQRPENHGQARTRGSSAVGDPSGVSAFQRSGLAGIQALSPYLRKECMSVLPPEHDFGVISDLYYTKFDPMFPIIKGEALEKHNAMEAVALKQCICLTAALDPGLKKNLRLPQTESILSQIDFRAGIAAAVKQSLDLGFIQDKMVLLQVCVLMAFFVDKPRCSDVSTYYAAQAVHHAQTLGLHLGWPGESSKSEKYRRVFWCVWVLDRLNAATNGRPVLIHRRDMDNRIVESISTQSPAFRLLIRITQFLDDVISKYRPHADTELQASSNEHQTFEDFVGETEAITIGTPLLASLEMFYIGVVILQDRPKVRQGHAQRASCSAIQMFSAANIISIASEDLKSSITVWPVLPYVVSLATSVAYKSLRNNIIPYKQKQAYGLFHKSCDVLGDLSNSFLSARAMAQLALDTMQEVGRVAVCRKANAMQDKVTPSQSRDAHSTGQTSMLDAAETGDSVILLNKQPHHSLDSRQTDSSSIDTTLFSQDIGSIPDVGTDLGIFSEFDSNFDLNRIDEFFTTALDPTIPMLSESWINIPMLLEPLNTDDGAPEDETGS
ncbi:hypothetical protein EDB81DRAFT_454125 [Dactylonectria macrodidyma]|uniref:Xylanolytic transcriptional activator regulatory domain-containing protein n=1 Tax=Dactylonectria macrodidyma TaxID=307937 RepID=A0A9P9F5U1_9HYPO|nr:hypothetical protein EDB81DRAFT_454125 [Dactylonectria macrodidyma]